jgi:hypothetical protein
MHFVHRISSLNAFTNTSQPSSLAKRMDEACATDLRELKRITFPEDATLTSELTSRPRSSRFQSAFAKPAGNTNIPAEPTATVTSSTIPSYYTRFQPATSTKSADNTTTVSSSTIPSYYTRFQPATKPAESTTSSVRSSTIPSYYTRFQPATTKSAENTTSSVGTSTTHTRTSSVSTRSTRPSRFQQVAKPAENTTVTTTTSSESRSSYSVSH